ncbi:hypothetical protein CHU98_g5541 [Xylaria longipes]|nr:hypothetical protein CHU98_g5541 [Xylaria longipes]
MAAKNQQPLPSSNIITNIQSRQPGYTLPFTEERRLAGILAFLAHIDDDPDHIPAVSLQEIPQTRSINILLAVNKGTPEDGKRYLSRIKGGFERIAATLCDVEDGAQNVERDVFAIIIELCSERILCRLRLRKKKRDPAGKKRTAIDGLQQIVDYLRKASSSSENAQLFLDRARKVLQLTLSWRRYQSASNLKELVEAVNSLRQTKKLKEIILESIPDQQVESTKRCHLLNMILKVSRYRESARHLVHAAGKFPMVQHMRVVVVGLPNDAFDRPTTSPDYRPTINSTISRAQNLSKSENDIKRMCDLLKTSVNEANTRYDVQVKNSLENSKIHAEIQLFYYYQIMLHGQPHLPRVICSSKSACWLCNAFILLQRKIHTPRSHGRLYQGWRLPNLHGGWFNDVAATFNQRLENVMTQSIKTLHGRKTRITYPFPIESTLSTITWLSAQPNDQKPLDKVTRSEKLEESGVVLVHDVTKSVEGTTTASRDETNLEELLVKDIVLEDGTSSDTPLSGSPISTVISGASDHANTSSGESSQGSQENIKTYRVALGDVSSVYPLGRLQLQFEYASGHERATHGDDSTKQLLCTAEWLSREEFQLLKLNDGVAIDAGSLTSEEVSHCTDTANNIYLSVDEAVLKLTMQPMSSAADASSKRQESRETREKPDSRARNSSARVSVLGSP